jgi:diaminopimelate decarboxylase
MGHFQYRDRALFCEDVPAADLAARYGTPLYVYSQSTLVDNLKRLQEAFASAEPLICYSIKSNFNTHIARLMAENGAGFDVTSGGELFRALKAGGTGEHIVFAGVAKTDAELNYGLDVGVRLFNVESEAELHRLAQIAAGRGQTAKVALRVNPSLPPKTHVKTDTSVKGTKFGLDIETILEAARGMLGKPGVAITGLHMHLGSPILDTKPYAEGAAKGVQIIRELQGQGHPVEYLNMGGGFGISYRKHEELPPSAFAAVILPAVRDSGCKLILEPGRFIAGNAGVLLSRVIYTKDSGGRHFVCQDAGMNDLIRPTLYDAFHRIWPVSPPDAVRPRSPAPGRPRSSGPCARPETSSRRTDTCPTCNATTCWQSSAQAHTGWS